MSKKAQKGEFEVTRIHKPKTYQPGNEQEPKKQRVPR